MSRSSRLLAVLGVVSGLGVAAMPLSSYAIDPVPKESEVQATIEPTLTLNLTSEADATAGATVNLGTLAADGDIAFKDLTARVKTNNGSGYNLSLATQDANNAMIRDGGTEEIKAGTPAKGKSAWGFKMGDIAVAADAAQSAAAVADYVPVPATGSAQVIVNSDKPTKVDETTPANSGDTAVITFGASANSAQAAGTYKATVVVTASANS